MFVNEPHNTTNNFYEAPIHIEKLKENCFESTSSSVETTWDPNKVLAFGSSLCGLAFRLESFVELLEGD